MKEIYTEATPIPYAIDICKYIKNKGFKNIIITNRSQNVIEILKSLNMDRLFDFVMYNENYDKRLYKPEFTIKALPELKNIIEGECKNE